MIIATTVLVIGDNQQGSGPKFRTVQRVIDVVQKLLAGGNIVIGMLAVSRGAPLRLEKYIAGETARRHSFLKVGELAEMTLRCLRDIGNRSARERRSVITVDAPGVEDVLSICSFLLFGQDDALALSLANDLLAASA